MGDGSDRGRNTGDSWYAEACVGVGRVSGFVFRRAWSFVVLPRLIRQSRDTMEGRAASLPGLCCRRAAATTASTAICPVPSPTVLVLAGIYLLTYLLTFHLLFTYLCSTSPNFLRILCLSFYLLFVIQISQRCGHCRDIFYEIGGAFFYFAIPLPRRATRVRLLDIILCENFCYLSLLYAHPNSLVVLFEGFGVPLELTY